MIERRLMEQLLEAEPDELRGNGDSELARLIRDDPAARAVARTILEANAAMDRALDRIGSRSPMERSGPPPLRAGRRSTAARLLTATGLAAAAVLTLLMARPGSLRRHSSDAAGPGALPLTARLEAASDRPFAVFATSNPDIAVVWLFQPEDR